MAPDTLVPYVARTLVATVSANVGPFFQHGLISSTYVISARRIIEQIAYILHVL